MHHSGLWQTFLELRDFQARNDDQVDPRSGMAMMSALGAIPIGAVGTALTVKHLSLPVLLALPVYSAIGAVAMFGILGILIATEN